METTKTYNKADGIFDRFSVAPALYHVCLTNFINIIM